jgi:hypothetical protein
MLSDKNDEFYFATTFRICIKAVCPGLRINHNSICSNIMKQALDNFKIPMVKENGAKNKYHSTMANTMANTMAKPKSKLRLMEREVAYVV